MFQRVSLITVSLQTLIFAVAPETKLQWELRGRLALALFTLSSIIQILHALSPPRTRVLLPSPFVYFFYVGHGRIRRVRVMRHGAGTDPRTVPGQFPKTLPLTGTSEPLARPRR